LRVPPHQARHHQCTAAACAHQRSASAQPEMKEGQ
jgi:hypothetical protein